MHIHTHTYIYIHILLQKSGQNKTKDNLRHHYLRLKIINIPGRYMIIVCSFKGLQLNLNVISKKM